MEILLLLLIILAAFKIQSILFTKRIFNNLNYNCRFSQSEAYEGDELQLVETVENKKLLPVPWLKVSIHSSRWLDFADSMSQVTLDGRQATSSFFLRGYQKITRRWKLKCLKRGVYEIENVTFVGGDILGVSSASIAVPVNAVIKVYPSIISLEDLFVPANFIQGETVVKRWIVDDPFLVSGAREYTPRDAMNRVHWSATARTGSLMVKKNDFTSQLSLSLIFNVQAFDNEYSDSTDKTAVEFGIKVAASMIDRGLRMGMPIRLGINSSVTKGGKETTVTEESAGTEHMFQLMEILAGIQLKATQDFERFLAEMDGGVENSHIFILTAYLNNVIMENVRKMQTSTNKVTVLLLDIAGTDVFPEDIDIYCISPDKAESL